jgi:Trk-type K+ transport system membrane component
VKSLLKSIIIFGRVSFIPLCQALQEIQNKNCKQLSQHLPITIPLTLSVVAAYLLYV